MDISVYLIPALVFVAVAILVLVLCGHGGDPRRRKTSDGYDGHDDGGWSFGGSQDENDFFSIDD
jgi:hypothetical protein